MKKIYNKNAREKQLLEEAYGAIYERRNPDAGEWGGGLKGVFPGAEEGPDFDEEEEGENNFKVGDEVYDDENELATIVNIDGGKVDLESEETGEGWTVDISTISKNPDHGLRDDTPFPKWKSERFWWQRGNEEEEHEGDHLAEAIKEMMKTFLDNDKFEGGLQDAFDITIEQIGDSLGYYNLENIGFTEDEEGEVEDQEIGLDIKDPAKAYKDLEGGEGKYL